MLKGRNYVLTDKAEKLSRVVANATRALAEVFEQQPNDHRVMYGIDPQRQHHAAHLHHATEYRQRDHKQKSGIGKRPL